MSKAKKTYKKSSKTQAERKQELYQQVTDSILEQMEQGKVPWHMPWSTSGLAYQSVDGREYRGVNVWILMIEAMKKGYDDPRWVTYKKAKALGGQVRKGEKSTRIIFFKPIKKEKENDAGEKETSSFMVMKSYNVFNVSQCDWEDGALKKLEVVENDNSPLECCEDIVANMPKKPEIGHGGAQCYYRPSTDAVNMVKIERFDGSEEYYATLFHELAHATGHTSRTGRLKGAKAIAPFGSQDYGKEELVAELTAAMVCRVAGIETRKPENHAAYIQGWMKTIKADKEAFLQAAQQAQRAADWILNQRQARDK